VWKTDYDIICEVEPRIKDLVSFDEYKAGKQLTDLRALDLLYTDGEIRMAIIPYVEMCPINTNQ